MSADSTAIPVTESQQSNSQSPAPDMGQLLSEIANLKKDNEGHASWRKKAATIFSGKEEEADDPFDRDVVRPAKEKGYGLTASIAESVRDLKKGTVTREEYTKLLETIEDLKQKADPENAVNQISLYSTGKYVIDAIKHNYPDVANDPKRMASFQQLIGSAVMEELKEMQKDRPMDWIEFRRDPDLQKKLVYSFISRFIPTSVRSRMQEDHESAKPITADNLAELWREAARIKDPDKQERMYAKIRETAIETGNIRKFQELLAKRS